MTKTKTLIATVLAVMLLGACSSGGIGDILGTGSNGNSYELRGTVDSVDTSSRSIWLTNVSTYNTNLSSGGSGGNTARVYYDDQTTVSWNGQTYRPQDLERGDQVTVRAEQQSSNVLLAESMNVTYNANSGMTSGSNYPDTYGTTIRGTVRYIDTSRSTIEISPTNGGSNIIVQYGSNTPVYYNNQTYRPSDLEVGDQIDVRYSNLGNGRVSAQDISVVRSISSGGGTTNNNNYATVRGTVRSIDTSRRTITLEQASWRSGFVPNNSSNLVTINYDNNIGINVNGQVQSLSGLERGDVIDVQVQNNGSAYWAQNIALVRDVRY